MSVIVSRAWVCRCRELTASHCGEPETSPDADGTLAVACAGSPSSEEGRRASRAGGANGKFSGLPCRVEEVLMREAGGPKDMDGENRLLLEDVLERTDVRREPCSFDGKAAGVDGVCIGRGTLQSSILILVM